MGNVSTTTNRHSGNTYTISTVQMGRIGESRIIEGGRFRAIMGAGSAIGLRFLERELMVGDSIDELHARVVRLASLDDPEEWTMSIDQLLLLKDLENPDPSDSISRMADEFRDEASHTSAVSAQESTSRQIGPSTSSTGDPHAERASASGDRYGPNTSLVSAFHERLANLNEEGWDVIGIEIAANVLAPPPRRDGTMALAEAMHQMASGQKLPDMRVRLREVLRTLRRVGSAFGVAQQVSDARTDTTALIRVLPAWAQAAKGLASDRERTFRLFGRRTSVAEGVAQVLAISASALVVRNHLTEDDFRDAYWFAQNVLPMQSLGALLAETEPLGAPPETDDVARWTQWASHLTDNETAVAGVVAQVGARVYELTNDADKARAAAISAATEAEIHVIVKFVLGGRYDDAFRVLGEALGPRPSLMTKLGWGLASHPYFVFERIQANSSFWVSYESAEICSTILQAAVADREWIGGALWLLSRHLRYSAESQHPLAVCRVGVHAWWSPGDEGFDSCAVWLAMTYARAGRADDGARLLSWIVSRLLAARSTQAPEEEPLPDGDLDPADYLRLVQLAMTCDPDGVLSGGAIALHGVQAASSDEESSSDQSLARDIFSGTKFEVALLEALDRLMS